MSKGPLSTLIAIALGAGLAAGCGGSGSTTTTQTKPAYCSDVASLKHSIDTLPTAVTGGVSGLRTTLTRVQSEAQSAISSAKADFSQQTQALHSSLAQLETTVKGLSSGASATQLVTLGLQATNAVKSAEALVNATRSKCS